MSRYAEATAVTSEASRAEIERTLTRYGATGYAYAWDTSRAIVGFVIHGRTVRFVLPLPDRNDFTSKIVRQNQHDRTGTRVRLTPDQQRKAFEQAVRQRWRALLLIIKAKLEAVEGGIVEFDTEFLAHIVLPDGHTVGEHVQPRIAAALESSTPPELLPRAIAGNP